MGKIKYSLKLLDFSFKWLFHLALKYASINIALCLILMLGFGYAAQHLRQAVAIIDQLDPDMQSTHDLKRLKQIFGNDTTVGFVLQPKNENFTQAELCHIQTTVNEIYFTQNNGGISRFMSPFKLRQAVENGPKLSYLRILQDPCETKITTTQPLAPLKNTFWHSLLTDDQARDLTVLMAVKDLEKSDQFGTFNVSGVDQLITSFQKEFGGQVWVIGTGAHQLFTMKGMEQTQVINIAVTLILLIAFRLLFGTWRSGLIFLFSVMFSATIVFGTMQLLGFPMDTLSSCLFLLMTVASLEDFIFVSYFHMETNNTSYKRSLRKLITPSFFTSLTTLTGFGSLAVSSLQSIRYFGLMAALGALLEWIFIFFILPSFLQKFSFLQKWTNPHKVYFRNISSSIIKKSPPAWLARVSLIVFVIVAASVGHYTLSQTPTEMFPEDHIFQKSISYIQKTRGWLSDAHLVFEPQVTKERRLQITEQVQKNQIVSKTESLEQFTDFMSEKIKKPSLTFDLVKSEIQSSGLLDRYKAESGEVRTIFYLTTSNTEKLNELRLEVNQLCPKHECWLAGEFIGFADFSKEMIKTLFDSLFLSLIDVMLIVLYLTVALNKRNFWAIILSSLWGPAWIMACMFIFKMPINLITCIVASTLVGLTGDNAIQYLFGGKDIEDGIENRGTGSIQCALIMSVCSLAFLGSYFEPPRSLGLLLAAGFILSLIGDLWILKALIKKRSH